MGAINHVWQNKNIRSAEILFLAGLLFLTVSCRQEPERPPIPRNRSELLLRLFDNLQQKNYPAALAQIEKLEAESPDSGYLKELRELLTVNACIAEAQTALNKGDLNKAIQTVATARNKLPFNRQLEAAEEDLTLLRRISNNIDELGRARSSEDLRIVIKVLDSMAVSYKPVQPLEKVLKLSRERRKQMEIRERYLTMFGLVANAGSLQSESDAITETAEALLLATENDSRFQNYRLSPEERNFLLQESGEETF